MRVSLRMLLAAGACLAATAGSITWLAVARERATLAPLDGQSFDALDGRSEIRVHEVAVEYRLAP